MGKRGCEPGQDQFRRLAYVDGRRHRPPVRVAAAATDEMTRVADDEAYLQRLRLLARQLTPPERPATAGQSSRPLGASGWRGWLPQLGVAIEVEPPDELRALALLMDPEQSRALLEAAIAEQSPRYRDLRIATCEPHLVRYSPDSRCTVVYRLGFDGVEGSSRGPELVVARIYRTDHGRVAWDNMRAVWDSPLSRGDPVHVAEPLAFVRDLNVVIQGPLRVEQTLKQLMFETWRTRSPMARARLDIALDLTADGLAALHGCGARAEVTVTWEDQFAEVRQWRDCLGNAIPALGTAAEPLLVELATSAADCPADPVGPAHRSFRPAKVLLCGAEAAIIDFDGLSLAEPALDVALFRATARVIALGELTDDVDGPGDEGALEHRADEVDALCDSFLARYESRRPVSRERVALYETLALLTVVLHCWTNVNPTRLRHGVLLLERQVERRGQIG